MQTLRPSQVPEYLRNSKFFLGLNTADDDAFSIPLDHMKSNMNVDTFADITELLNTIRFWGLDVFPEDMVDFVTRQRYRRYREVKSILEPYRADLPFICAACTIACEILGGEKRVEKAMGSGNIDIVKYFHKKGGYFTTRAIAAAAGKGAMDCLQYGLTAKNTFTTAHGVFGEAVRNGHLDCILLLQKKGFVLPGLGSNLDDLVANAASSGQLDVLKYLHSQGCSLIYAATAAAEAGHWDCLEYAVENGSLLRVDYRHSVGTLTLAQRLARAEQLKLFPMALSRAGQIDSETTLNFARSGNWDMFKLCIQYITRPTLNILNFVIEKGFLASLQRLHEVCVSELEASGNGQNWLTYAASNNSTTGNSSKVDPSDLAPSAAKTEQWDCLRFLIAHGCPVQKSLTTVLAKAGQEDLYRIAVANSAEVSVQAACYFARDGNLDLLQHALEHGCERSEEILQTAARYGQLQCLKYAHAQGCPWSAQVTLAAARGGHRECLQYLHEHDCPSSEYARSVLRKRSNPG